MQKVSDAYHFCPSLPAIVSRLVNGGLASLAGPALIAPGVPVKPMLAKISAGYADAARQLGPGRVLAEWKYDGQRA